MTEEMRIRCPRCRADNADTRIACAHCQWLLSTPYPQGYRGRRDHGTPARASLPARSARRAGRWVWLTPALLGAVLLCTPIAFLGGYTVGWTTQKPSDPPVVEWKTRTVTRWRTRTVTARAGSGPATVPGALTWSGDTWPIQFPVLLVNPATGQTFATDAEVDTGAQAIYSTPRVAQALGLPVLYRATQENVAGPQPTTVYGPLEIETRGGRPLLRVMQDYAQLTDAWYALTNYQVDLGQAFWGLPDVHLSVQGPDWTLTVDPAS